LRSNYFYYVRDPWGSYYEDSSDIDYIPVDCDWKPDDHPPEDSIYPWGPEPPKNFATSYEAEIPAVIDTEYGFAQNWHSATAVLRRGVRSSPCGRVA
jgi:hypothetical protein